MKFHILLGVVLFVSGLCISCGNNASKGDTSESMPADSTGDTVGVVYEGPPPIEEEPKSDSPFFSAGCCKETEKRLEDCCCLKVLEEYGKMKKTKPITFVAQLKMNDVILSNCYTHNRYSEKFEAIDYPEEE
jgi:hypothetical protein